MTTLARDSTYQTAQVYQVPATGVTTTTAVGAGSSQTTAALAEGIYRLVTDAAISIASGATAVAADMPIAANTPEYIYVPSGQTLTFYAASAANVTLSPLP